MWQLVYESWGIKGKKTPGPSTLGGKIQDYNTVPILMGLSLYATGEIYTF